MADVYLEVPVTTDSATLADNAIAAIQAVWPDWEPNDGDLEVVIIEAIAAMAADAAETASQVPASIFDAFGQAYAGIARNDGTYATATVTIMLADTTGQTIPAGTEIDIDGTAFATDDEIVAGVGTAELDAVPVTATDVGAEANNLSGSVVSPISALARVTSVTLDAPTSGGSDAETDDEFLNRLSSAMELQGTTLVTTRDFELLALEQPDVERALAVHLGARAVRFTGIDAAGNNLSAGTKTALGTLFALYRMVNTTVTIADPTRTTIVVTYTVVAYTDADPVTVKADIDAMLADLLSPLSWGVPASQSDERIRRWVSEPTIHVNKIIDRIGNVPGVDYVVSVALAGGTRAVTATQADDKLHLVGHGFASNQPVRFSGMTGGAGLSAGTTYYVITDTVDTFKVSASAGPGAAVNITTDMSAGQVGPYPAASGDLTMPGDTPLPQPGTMVGTIT